MNARTLGRSRRMASTAVSLLALALLAPPEARPQEIVKRIGRVTIRVDASRGFPGGVMVVRLASTGRLGAAWALLDGRRAPFYREGGTLRALVPVPAGDLAGPATLGIGIAARRGEQRIPIPVAIGARAYPARTVLLPPPAAELLARPEASRDSRRLLAQIHSESPTPEPGRLLAPVAAAASGYGELRTYPGRGEVESRIDGLTGERHRALDYAVAPGTPVRAPGAGTVLLAEPLVLSGGTVVIDHGQGVVSVLMLLARLNVRRGDTVAPGAPIGLSGADGLLPHPLLQWRVYLHGVAVDPLVLAAILRP